MSFKFQKIIILLFFSLYLSSFSLAKAGDITVGSKIFTESYVLAEGMAQKIENNTDYNMTRRLGMGGTGILYQAIVTGEIDFYPEYTGTISEAILRRPELVSLDEIREALIPHGLTISESLGFNNTYALAVTEEFANQFDLKSISDLKGLESPPRLAFSHEFVSRADGLGALRSKYGLNWGSDFSAMDHGLLYEAISNREVDVIEVYSTDAKVSALNLVVLEDDLSHFPDYQSVVLARIDFVESHPEAWMVLKKLEGSIDEISMSELNALVDIERMSFSEVGTEISGMDQADLSVEGLFASIYSRGKEHLVLVLYALGFSILMGIPLGIMAFKNQYVGQPILLLSGIIQTIPSLALLCLLIPFFGIGTLPALVALCLYGLLPVVLNTLVGLRSIDPKLLEMSRAMGLKPLQSLVYVELPLASRSILAGIKTSAIIGIGTATLAALIGAGGFGVPIVAGLAINDIPTILTGAIPAALMALVAHGVFEVLGIIFVPKGLR